MIRWLIVAFGIAPLVGIAGCLAPAPVDPVELAPVQVAIASSRVNDLIDLNKRLVNVEHALTTSSAKRCGALARPQSGMILSRAGFFEDRMIQNAAGSDHALGRDLRILHVVQGGGADRAGLQVGDEVLEVDGERLQESGELRDHLLKLANRTSVMFKVRRNGKEIRQPAELEVGCPVVFKLTDGSFALIPRSTTQLIVSVTRGLLDLIDDDNVLAVMLAHELAHTGFDDEGKSWPTQEARADRLGLIIAAQAGYDVGGAEGYWERVALEYPKLIDEAPKHQGPLRDGFENLTHYGIANRMAAIRTTVAEIQAQISQRAEAP
ncbi:MAG: M48 family metallopeptidase [Myxococcota bacterium]